MAKSSYSTVMLLVETSDEGMKAAREAVGLAADSGSTLIVASVVDTALLRQLLTYRIFVQEEMEEYETDMKESARKHLDYVCSLADREGVNYERSLLTGATHSVVLEEQRKTEADLLIMAAFRASTATRDVMAREKQLILDEIRCPILLVR